MTNVELLHGNAATDLTTLRIQHDHSNDSHWCFMHAQQAFSDPTYRACFSPRLLRELRLFARQAIEGISATAEAAGTGVALSHIVLGSDTHVFNLGGDLALFAQLIRARDRDGLMRYASECVDNIHLLHSRLHPNAHTIALVEGDALGGGFELALACQTIVAESGVQMGFPEVLFGLFPGMGAYSLLSRRVSPKLAEEMMLNGVMYSSDELHRMGVVDVLVPKGEGVRAVHEVIRQNRRIAAARLALHRVREVVNPVSHQELMDITRIWVDTALQLGDKQLRIMERLVRAQLRRPEPQVGVEAAAR
ncbi:MULTISPECIES: crotonase/enoyl-CoA hydratase family protein [unclassified Luteimonas]|uniref:crotonase/enoyl-CoA hydratase family protein n=1 Tax=unclassified Luteimonas TaxID=2629088 RepID=UPI001600B4C6|nr:MULTISPECIES: crotonase/enoyl-CoA hydratase family protein [unclassified Luteimonas]MBB1471952.1 crotonase/enoyl-CoA hydratase family protein [Luteimonas sp. MC1782]MBB6599319.1 crotonase/enoyl-CoA hydratase family protein [Luteimonas sp. MC1825]QOC87033.1 crotonase/enoyl-CoA hydratase family protein [Luteimonas sp. MC1825]